jgi:hypothetical protein
MTPLDPLAWKQLVDAIAEEKAILFLGPGVTVNYQLPDAQERFFKGLAEKYPERILSYHEDDGLLVFKNVNEKRLLFSEIRAFYKAVTPNPVLELLAQIPFHLYVVVTPDLSLNHAFAQVQRPFEHEYYTTKIKRTLEDAPSAERPLLYNLLGCESEPESLVTNHGDFFDLIQSIYGDKNLPDDLVSFFHRDRTHNIIFLGFQFDKWYFQMLLHLLRINFDQGFLYAAAKGLPTSDNKTLMEAQFKVSFVSDDIEGFVGTLHQQFYPHGPIPAQLAPITPRRYNLPNILKFIRLAFSPQEFETFCIIHFPVVRAEFTSESLQTTRINLLMEYLQVHGLYAQLLEKGRAENPFQYDHCGPYHEA